MKNFLLLFFSFLPFFKTNGMESKIKSWLQRLEATESIPSNIVALNFGLFEQEDGYCIYLIGAKVYDEDDDDWACTEDYEPKEKYLPLTYKEIGKKMGWKEFQNNVVKILTAYLKSSNTQISKRIVTTGFDDGSLVRI